ncbi:uncharacterized protein LOC133311584 [Gastrolobium bilobum]|uniref:uncharacterized protein LOC133311584 n=1 Tax=Gastrolobium bilobum TaxID=150636 RepID=UPI002AB151F1|nr:uncharacterized protein LOC133311584 [Gastrolobium bilobum]
MKAAFLNGLKEAIRAELRVHLPEDLSQMMKIAQRIEEKENILGQNGALLGRNGVGSGSWGGLGTRTALPNRETRGNGMGFQNSGRNRPQSTAQMSRAQSEGNTQTTASSGGNVNLTRNVNQENGGGGNAGRTAASSGSHDRRRGSRFRRLSQEEMDDHWRRNLCFRCYEPFFPGHVCQHPQLHVMILAEGGEEPGEEELQLAAQDASTEETVHLGVHSVVGLTSNKSLKLLGKVNGLCVVVLIDTGASHNFLATHIVEALRLPMDAARKFNVEVGDGHRVVSPGRCRNVTLVLPNLKITQDFFVFDLRGVDLILGYEWLVELGDIKENFKERMLKIPWQGAEVTISGDPSLSCSGISSKGLGRSCKKGVEIFYMELGYCSVSADDEQKKMPLIVNLLKEYEDVFEPLSELPPKRACDHRIRIKEGASIPNIRPYRYPHYQKEKIEKFVRDMLTAGMIRPSTSPYSSPLIMVKKKDGSWRFCTDYKALNKVTVPDKFPLPVIDELLDELGGAEIFSKLDFKSGYNQIRMRGRY